MLVKVSKKQESGVFKDSRRGAKQGHRIGGGGGLLIRLGHGKCGTGPGMPSSPGCPGFMYI